MPTVLNEVDQKIRVSRLAERDAMEGYRIGDYVQFADRDHPVRRIAILWGNRAQTTDGGSFYLGESGGSSFSGSLWPSVPFDMLTLSEETLDGSFWFYSHNFPTAAVV